MQLHVDPLGGWSGDMFVAACLDAFPELWPTVEAAVLELQLGPQAACRLVPHGDGVLTGHRFLVAAEPHRPAVRPLESPLLPHAEEPPEAASRSTHSPASFETPASRAPQDEGGHGLQTAFDEPPHDHGGRHDASHHHEHTHGPHRAWSDIRQLLRSTGLPGGVTEHAVGIFSLLAEAEASVHGVPVDAVEFHEVGAVDSIVDIVAAATLIARIGATRWTSAPLPLGGGRVRTAHGPMPVPAPATAMLLRGLPTIDDGVGGERVTPTGAAIARHLLGTTSGADHAPRILARSGTGFGTRTLPGLSNCLRVLAFDEPAHASKAAGLFGHRELCVIAFEVDDQSAEDLALGLDHIRAHAGVHDVTQSVVFGKKGRLATHVQVLVAPDHRDAVIAACFTETATIGLRYHVVQGAALHREAHEVAVDGHSLRVKTVVRPDGSRTGKTEAHDVAAAPGRAGRAALRQAGEAAALAADPQGD